MSEQPLDFLKDFDDVQENKKDAAASAAVDQSVQPSSDGNESNPTGRKILRRKKRVPVTKREQQRVQNHERRRQARQVILVECNCHLSCPKRISTEQRQSLNKTYWEMNHAEQKKFVKSHTVPGPVKRRRVPVDPLGGSDVKKAFSYAFYLPDDQGQLHMVCCTFFLNTLGFRKGCGNHIYRAHMRESVADKRGKYERDRSLRDAVWDDILSYSPRTYHKGSKFNATALYLPNQLTAKSIHAEFKARREAIGEKGGSASFYCAVLREMDVHFVEMDDFVIPERMPIPVVLPKPPSSPPPVPVQPLPQSSDVVEVEDSKIQMKLDDPQPVCSYDQPAAIVHTFQSPPPILVQNEQAILMHSYSVEQKPIVPRYANESYHHASPPFHSVTVKQEPYYGINVESMSVSESHFSGDHDDYSDSYSNMVVEPDYSESNSHHEPPYGTPMPVVSKLEPPAEIFPRIVKSEKEIPPTNPYEYQFHTHSEAPKPKPHPPKKKPVEIRDFPKPALELFDLPEGYPPMKRTKKFIARIRNRAKRKQSHPVLQLECNCHLNCKEKVSSQQQQRINERYWSMTFPEQRMFMLEHTERHSIKRRRTKLEPGVAVRKGFTYSYRLTDALGDYQPVCCQFYLNTIGYGAGSGNLIYRAHQVELSKAISDRRGKFARDTTLRDTMDDDIMTYFSPELQESGGPFDLSVTELSPKKMYNQYVQRQLALGNDKPGSFGFYWRRTKQLKVIFAPKPEPKTTGKKKSRPSVVNAQKQLDTLMNPVEFSMSQ